MGSPSNLSGSKSPFLPAYKEGYLYERKMFVFHKWTLGDALKCKMKIFLLMSHQEDLSISSRAKYLSSTELIELVALSQLTHLIDSTCPYASFLLLLCPKLQRKYDFRNASCRLHPKAFSISAMVVLATLPRYENKTVN